ncbi:aminotransferase class IV [Streptomyces murinus]|uniref:aminotransferase class IV n=1 Tax=Streptomyces murinus TaxID=33900 RepID=UPI0037F760F8
MATLNQKPATVDDLLPLALTSYAHFTSMRVGEDGRIRGLSMHLARLVRDSKIVFGADLDTGAVRDQVRQALDGRSTPCTVRVTIYDPTVSLAHPADADQPGILITIRPAGALPPPPLRAKSIPYERDLPEVKHCGLFGALNARATAERAGFDDALFVGRNGLLSEGGTWNVGFIDRDGEVVWPHAPVLPGVTMALLKERVDHRVTAVTLAQAKQMPVAFATNTSVGVRVLSCIDDTDLSVEHPVLSTLRDTYLSIQGEEL